MIPTNNKKNDNATAGLVERYDAWCEQERRSYSGYMTEDPEGDWVRFTDYTDLQARVAEVEAELALHRVLLVSATERSEQFEDERDAALSREKEAKAEGMREAAEIAKRCQVFNEADGFDDTSVGCAEVYEAILLALAQSGGADPAQGKGDE